MEEVYVQIRELNEMVFCERLHHLMYVQGLFENNADTLEGSFQHQLREGTEQNNLLDGVKLSSLVLYALEGKLGGKIDGICEENGEYIPIEDKHSKKPGHTGKYKLGNYEVETEVWINDFAQLIGEVFVLRANGYATTYGKIYYRGSNELVKVEYLPEYDDVVKMLVEKCIENHQKTMPEPLIDSEKCIRCSLNWICLPEEVNTMKKECSEPRRLFPGRPDSGILYVTSVGSKVGKEGECFSIWRPTEKSSLVPIKDVEHICVYGNVQVTTQAMQVLTDLGGSVFYFSSGGWMKAVAGPLLTKNVLLRKEQFLRFEKEDFKTGLIRAIVAAKIENQRTLIRRNGNENTKDVLLDLKRQKTAMEKRFDVDSLRGYEGNAAKSYWKGYNELLDDSTNLKMDGRNRRPPKDEVNAMLSYGYSLLLRDFISAIATTGMDYLYGFFHSVIPGRPALALDLMEPYRPLIVDSVVLRMVNEKIINKKDFVASQAGVIMKPSAKKALIEQYEKRVDEMITHPKFGYRLSYRRMFALEAKLLGKYIEGELDEYYPLTTR